MMNRFFEMLCWRQKKEQYGAPSRVGGAIFVILSAFLPLLTMGAIAQSLSPLEMLNVGAGDWRVEANEPVSAKVVPARTWVSPGGTQVLAVQMVVTSGHHVNSNAAQAQEGQIATEIKWGKTPAGIDVGAAQFPAAHDYQPNSAVDPIAIYAGTVTLYLPLRVSLDAVPGPVEMPLTLRYQVCTDEVCFPPTTQTLTARFEVGHAQGQAASETLDDTELFAGFDPSGFATMNAAPSSSSPSSGLAASGLATGAGKRLGLQLLVAALAGFLMNFTPCVLPVVPLKVMGLAAHGKANASLDSGQSKGPSALVLAGVMGLGIVGFWMALAVALTGIKQFSAVNQMFQYPAFNVGLGLLLAVLAVSRVGVFTVNLPRALYQFDPTSDTVVGSLGFGVMTAVLATPCAGPLMGGALGWATQQGTVVTLLIFGALGAGMAAPYLVLTAFPGLLKHVPRAGAGSEVLKQVMGLLLLAGAAYFIGTGWVGWNSDGTSANASGYWWAVGACVVAAGGWLAWRGVRMAKSRGGQSAVAALAVALVLAGGYVGWRGARPGEHGIAWVYYTPQRLAQLQERGEVVVLDFTAEWCLNCKVLEKTVLETDAVRTALAAQGVTPVKVDITSVKNVEGNALLKDMQWATIPLLVVLDPAGEVVFKSGVYTPNQVVEAVLTAKRRE